jgi:hypothetical protein
VDDAPELDVTAEDLKKEKDILIATIAAKQKMEDDRDAFLHDSYVRLVSAGDDLQGRPVAHHLKPTWCTCCERTICIEKQEKDKQAWLIKTQAIDKLGIDIKETEKQTTQCELEKLVDFCLRQDKVINSHGKLDPERVILHDTALSINLREQPHFKTAS